MDIPVNAKVLCVDGAYGRSVCIVLNPVTEQITHVVVEAEGFPGSGRLAPLGLIRESQAGLIHLACAKADVDRLEAFCEAEFLPAGLYGLYGPTVMWPYSLPEMMSLTVQHERIPHDELAIHRGARVEARDGPVGQVDEFLVEPIHYHITHLVLREGHFWAPKDVTIPVAQIDRIEADTVYLKMTRHDIGALPAIPLRRRKA